MEDRSSVSIPVKKRKVVSITEPSKQTSGSQGTFENSAQVNATPTEDSVVVVPPRHTRYRDLAEVGIDCWSSDGTVLLRSFRSVKAAVEALSIPHAKFIVDVLSASPPRAYGFEWSVRHTEIADEDSLTQTMATADLMKLRQPSLEEETLQGFPIKIECYNQDGSERMLFPNLAEAARFFKVTRTEILDCCFGERKTLKRRVWAVASSETDGANVGSVMSTEEFYESKSGLPVDCWSSDNAVLLRRFDTSFEARDALHLKSTALVIDCCLNKKVLVSGFRFKFTDPKSALLVVANTPIVDMLALRKPPILNGVVMLEDDKGRPTPSPSFAVDCYTADGSRFLRRFVSLTEIKKVLCVSKTTSVKECCSGTRTTALGFSWKLSEDGSPPPSDEQQATDEELLQMKGATSSLPRVARVKTAKEVRVKEVVAAEPKPSQQISCYSADGATFLHRFNDAKEAARQLNVQNVSDIKDCAEGKRPTFLGFVFAAADDKTSDTDGVPLDQLLRLRVPPILYPSMEPSRSLSLSTTNVILTDQTFMTMSDSEESEATALPAVTSVKVDEDKSSEEVKHAKSELKMVTDDAILRSASSGLPVDCWKLDYSQLLWRFPSIRDAKRVLRLSEPQVRDIKACCIGRRPSVVGLAWSFLDDSFVPLTDQVSVEELLSLRRPPLHLLAADGNANHHRRPLLCTAIDGSDPLIFPSSHEAAKHFKVPKNEIVDTCLGARKNLKKRKWQFADEDSLTSEATIMASSESPSKVTAAADAVDMDIADAQSESGSSLQRAPVPTDSSKDGGHDDEAIDCLTLGRSKILYRFKTVHDVVSLLKCDGQEVVDCCLGKVESAFGFCWRFRLENLFLHFRRPISTEELLSMRNPQLSESGISEEADADSQSSHEGSQEAEESSEHGVDCWSSDGSRLLHRFPTLDLIKKALRIRNTRSVVECSLGTRHTAHGFRWTPADPTISIDYAVSVEELMTMRDPPCSPPSFETKPSSSNGGGRLPVPVDCWSLDGSKLLFRFAKIGDALETLRIPKSADIKECCEGKRQSAFGFLWKFMDPSRQPAGDVTPEALLLLRVPHLPIIEPPTPEVEELSSSGPVAREVKNSMPVDCFSLGAEGRLLFRFVSLNDAVKTLQLHRRTVGTIKDCILELRPSAFGFVWKFVDNSIESTNITVTELLSMRDPPYVVDKDEPIADDSSLAISMKSEVKLGSRARVSVDCFSLDGDRLLRRFDTIGEALITLDLPRKSSSDISECCIGKVPSAFGFVWKFSDPAIDIHEYFELSNETLCALRDPPLSQQEIAFSVEREIKSDRARSVSVPTAVDCWSLDGERLLKRFTTMSEALRALRLRVSTSDIRSCCEGTCESAFGFVWRYRDDEVRDESHVVPTSRLLQLREPPCTDGNGGSDDEARRQLANPGRTPIPVDCWSLDGSKMLKRFSTISHALKALRLTRFSDIKDCLLGTKDSAFGFQWKLTNKYTDDVVDEISPEELLCLRDPPFSADEMESIKKETTHIGGRAAVPVDCLSLDGAKLLRRFNSIAEARDSLQIKSTVELRDCCHGTLASAFGFRWKFRDGSKKFESPELTIFELLRLRDPPLSKYSKKVIPRDNLSMPVNCFDAAGKHLVLFPSVREAAKAFRIDMIDILDCCYGLTESHLGKVWRLADAGFAHLTGVTIDCVAINGDVLRRFSSEKEAAELLGIPYEDITKCCSSSIPSVLGFRFRYSSARVLEDVEKVSTLPRNVLSIVEGLGGASLDSSRSPRSTDARTKSARRPPQNTGRERLEEEGWQFSLEQEPNIGVTARKPLPAGGHVDGKVEAYLAESPTNGSELWRVRFDDDTYEEVTKPELLQLLSSSTLTTDPSVSGAMETPKKPDFLRQKNGGLNSVVKGPALGDDHQAAVPSMCTCRGSLECTQCTPEGLESLRVFTVSDNWPADYLSTCLMAQILPGHVMRSFDSIAGEGDCYPNYVCVLSYPFTATTGGEMKVSVYDGSEVQNINCNHLKSWFLDDELIDVLADARHNEAKALKELKRRVDVRLNTQLREREIEVLASFKKTHSDDVLFLYQSLHLQNRLDKATFRPIKEIIDVYHRFVAREALKISTKLLKIFRRADDALGRRPRAPKTKQAPTEEKGARKAQRTTSASASANAESKSNVEASSEVRLNVFEDSINPVVGHCIDNAEVVWRFPSPFQAATQLKVAQVSIINCLKAKQPSAFGFRWEYDRGNEVDAGGVDDGVIMQYKKIYDQIAVIALECYDTSGAIRTFPSIRDAAYSLKSMTTQKLSTKALMKDIYDCCTGDQSNAFGLSWRYCDTSSMPYTIKNMSNEEFAKFLILPSSMKTSKVLGVNSYSCK